MRTPLDEGGRAALAAACPAWVIERDQMFRTFRFADFRAAMAFVTSVALSAERADHHPDIDIRWNEVTLVLSTHSAGTLTDADADLARAADAAADG